jgi:hypothetical protein
VAAGGVVVRGGPGGTAARLEDLDRAGAHLLLTARAMSGVAARAARVAADPRLVGSAVLSPGTWLDVERRLWAAVGPPSGAVAVAARLVELAVALRGVSSVYRAADTAVVAGLHAVDASVGRAVGTLLGVSVIASVLTGPVPTTVAAGEVAALAGLVDGSALLARLGAHPRAVEHAVDALPGVVGGLTDLDPAVPLLLLPVTGLPTVPLDVPGGARWLARVASAGPWLHESAAVAVTTRRPASARAPQGCAELVQGITSLDPGRGASEGTVRVTTVNSPGGGRAHVVQIPGTQSWSPRAGGNPFDLTGNVRGMAGEPTAGRQLLAAALREAGVRPGEPVMLVGHSQGGLVAAQAASDPAFRASYQVTHVLAVGAPIGATPVPDEVSVLAVEHDEDLVPRADGTPNPDRPRWLTVSASVTPPGGAPDPAAAHGLAAYSRTATAIDTAPDAGLAAWRAGVGSFLDAPGVTATAVEVTGQRVPGDGC